MNQHEKINYIELPAKDLEAVKAFFTNAFGWKFVKAIFAFPGGRRAHFTDPNGNEYAVWSDK